MVNVFLQTNVYAIQATLRIQLTAASVTLNVTLIVLVIIPVHRPTVCVKQVILNATDFAFHIAQKDASMAILASVMKVS
jgi:hypothetical protein